MFSQVYPTASQFLEVLLGQPGSETATLPPTASMSDFDWIRIMILLLIMIAGTVLTFFVIYPSVLKRSTSLMPLTLYGRCLGGLLILVQGSFLVLYWRELVFGDPTKSISHTWPKGAVIAFIIISFILSGAYFKTPKAIRS